MDDSNSQVSLRHTSDPTKVIAIAINSIKTDDLIDDIGFGRLKMDVGSSKELHDIKVPLLKMFDKSFQSIINQEETLYSCKKWDDYYYFANDWRFGPYDDYADSPCDDRDYMRDTWDAMTDGMYGDMPDGWDGDYEFLGY